MRVLVIALLLASFASLAYGEDNQPLEKKAADDPNLADFAGNWKSHAMVVAGRSFEAVELTIQPDGKTKASYQEKKGDQLTPSSTEFRIKLVKVEFDNKVKTITYIEDFLGVPWQRLTLASPNDLIAVAIIEDGGEVIFVEYAFKRVQEKK